MEKKGEMGRERESGRGDAEGERKRANAADEGVKERRRTACILKRHFMVTAD